MLSIIGNSRVCVSKLAVLFVPLFLVSCANTPSSELLRFDCEGWDLSQLQKDSESYIGNRYCGRVFIVNSDIGAFVIDRVQYNAGFQEWEFPDRDAVIYIETDWSFSEFGVSRNFGFYEYEIYGEISPLNAQCFESIEGCVPVRFPLFLEVIEATRIE